MAGTPKLAQQPEKPKRNIFDSWMVAKARLESAEKEYKAAMEWEQQCRYAAQLELGRTEMSDKLTRREHEVLVQIQAKKSNKEISTALFISVRTVKHHVSNLLAKFSVANRDELRLTTPSIMFPQELNTFAGGNNGR